MSSDRRPSGARLFDRLQSAFAPAPLEAATTAAFRVLSSGAVLTGLVYAYTTSHAVIGLLGAIPLCGRLAHLAVPRLVARYGPARVARWAAIGERLGFLGAGVAGILGGAYAVAWILVGLALGAISGAIYDTAFTALAADAVAPERRGRFFGVRTRWLSAFSVLAGLLGGALVDALEHGGVSPALARGLTLLVGAIPAMVALRALTRFELERVEAIAARQARGARSPTLSQAMRAIAADVDPTARAALLFALGWGFATGLIQRHVDAFALGILGFSVGTLAVVAGLVGGAGFIGAMTWGRLGDRLGAKRIVAFAALIVAFNPLWYALSVPGHTWPFWVGQVVGGVANAGWMIGIPLLFLRGATGGGTVRTLAIFHAAHGIAAGLGPLVGGVVLHALEPIGAHASYVALFLMSFTLRLMALRLLHRIPEEQRPRSTRVPMSALYRREWRRVRRRFTPEPPAPDRAA